MPAHATETRSLSLSLSLVTSVRDSPRPSSSLGLSTMVCPLNWKVIRVGHLTGLNIRKRRDVGALVGNLWRPFARELLLRPGTWLASVLIWVYCLVGNIVLVNMLIAMFADTYTKIASQSEIEYFFLRSTHLYEYQSSAVLSVPPVLNLPLILMAVLRRIRGWHPSDTLTMIALAARSDSIQGRRSNNSSDSWYERSTRNVAEKKGRSQAGMPALDFDGKLLVDAQAPVP